MSFRIGGIVRHTLASAVAAAVFIGYTVTAAPIALADTAPANPASPVTPATVSADGLPTVQINGVVWSQVVVGNTVYAAGSFTRARPAGVPAGQQETVRNNLLAYDIRTGQLITGFAPDLNGQAFAVTASPDGSRIYVGGHFSKANGQDRYSIAAYDTATGQLSSWQPIVGADVHALAVTSKAVYVGGDDYGVAGGAARNFLAALDPTTGNALPWAPIANNAIDALVVTPAGNAVVIGGHLTSLNGSVVNGLGEVDAVTGASLPFAASTITRNGGVDSGFTGLSADADTVYATGYSWNGMGNLEGMLAINPVGGAVRWIDDCHGDSYSVYATNAVEYIAGHAHMCSNIGGFPQVGGTDQSLWTHHRAIAFSKSATGKVGNETGNFAGQPAPSPLVWYPDLEEGTYTGQHQGPWNVAGNSSYVVYGGEFPTVNGTAQQGLVRFAVPSIAPNKRGPDASTGLVPSVTSTEAGTTHVSWQTTSDQDNGNLTYDVYRSDRPTSPIYETVASSTFWAMPELSFADRTAPAGKTVSYRVTARDPFGNTVTGPAVSVAVATAPSVTLDPYASAVLGDTPTSYWRLDEASSGTFADQAGTFDMNVGTGVTVGTAGALQGTKDTAASFDGTSNGFASTKATVYGPNVFSLETWFRSTSTSGGLLLGLGNASSGQSGLYDRHLTLNQAGQVTFGVNNGALESVVSPAAYNDGRWHHVVGTLSTAGMALYVDGKAVGGHTDVTSAQSFQGYWRIGGDSTWDGSGPYVSASVDEVAVYTSALTSAQIARHFALGSGAAAPNTPPTASFTSTVSGLGVAVDGSASSDAEGPVASYAWDFGDGSTGTGKTASHTFAAAGTYSVKLTVTDSAGATGSTTKPVTVTAPAANTPPTASFTSTVSGLGVAVDGSASSDAEGPVASYAWDFGDGSTGTGKTASHTFAAAGTYSVKLTVTDSAGATGSTTKPVTVTAPPAGAALASDAFGRTVASGWGTADVGGAWTTDGAAGSATVGSGVGSLTAAAANGAVAQLLGISAKDVALQADVSLAKAATGGGTFVTLGSRMVGSTMEDAQLEFDSDGSVTLILMSVVNGAQTVLGYYSLPITYTPGTAITVRFEVQGTTVRAKAWTAGTTEPATWQVTGTDTAAATQQSGALQVQMYDSSTATAAQTLRVDNVWAGAAGTTPNAPAPAPNTPPTASFTSTVSGLGVAVDGSASSDAEGPVASYAWDFGDGSTGTGKTASHTFAAAGTYSVKLTVTDSAGATGSTTKPVTVTAPAANTPPTASFTSTVSGLGVAVDGSASSDAEGPVASYAWDFGDGSTGTGKTASHTFAAAGTYSVKLTVTDSAGATGSTTKPVTVTAPPAGAALASDAFGRTVASGWGTADVGGAWTTDGAAGSATVGSGVGSLTAAAANGAVAQLLGISAKDVALQADVSLAKAATGGGTFVTLGSRMVGSTMEDAQLEFDSDGSVTLILMSVVNGAQTVLGYYSLPITYTPGTAITVRFEVQGTTVRAKAWTAGTTEPATWQVTGTDTAAATQQSGALQVQMYDSSTATAAQTLRVDNVWAGAAGTKP